MSQNLENPQNFKCVAFKRISLYLILMNRIHMLLLARADSGFSYFPLTNSLFAFTENTRVMNFNRLGFAFIT